MNKNELLENIIQFFENEEGWDKESLIQDYISEMHGIPAPPDEVSLVIESWNGTEHLSTLDDFARDFFDKVIEGVCNVLESKKEPSIERLL